MRSIADVADVHLLGGVRRGVVDDDLLARARLRNAALRLGAQGRELSVEPRRRDREVQEAGTRDLDLLETGGVEVLDHLLRGLTRIHLELLGALERVIALVVAEFGVRRRHHAHARKITLRKRLLKGRLHYRRQFHSSSPHENPKNGEYYIIFGPSVRARGQWVSRRVDAKPVAPVHLPTFRTLKPSLRSATASRQLRVSKTSAGLRIDL